MYHVKVPFGVFPEALNETYPIGQSEISELECEGRDATLENILNFIKSHPEASFTFAYDPVWECPMIAEVGKAAMLMNCKTANKRQLRRYFDRIGRIKATGTQTYLSIAIAS